MAFCASALAVAKAETITLQVVNDVSTTKVKTEESLLANVVVDAIRSVDKLDVAFMPASAFSDVTIAKGTTTPAEVLKCLEYRDDTVVIVNLTGAVLRKALEHALSLCPQKNPAFLQVSGITVSIDPNADKDKRILTVKVGKNALDNAKSYTVAMPSPLANGALGYFKVWAKTDIARDTDKSLEDAVKEYLAKQKPQFGVKAEERLAFKK